ncbi:hypothetical protein HNR46_003586 [Haloferula luteola]|uniref:Uncharacterized protein n=1 Tax=Haloferula luteola TaxID=595692 RepID=A0A840VHL5_9BACT|nr:DUF3820 family protein [Haloferula luteola]MBB5353330.1 hypothetical protein [Haloferula luteola]
MNEIDREDFRNLLNEIGRTRMPFGKYGPKEHPPRGYPIYDLPVEYLTYFKERGFPKGRLGELLEWVWEMKANGMDPIFHPLRQAAGGRTRFKPKRTKEWDFEE